jgi:MOSC domain-containing protein YiiM
MKVLSVNVAQPRPITLAGQEVLTGIFKEPVAGPVTVRGHNLAGDAQADLQVHGGEYKAVYAYPFEHYPYWESVLSRAGLAPGAFGENLTIVGLLEDRACIGDVYRIGSALLQVTQPRIPCGKLGYKFARPQLLKEFLQSGRSGFYLRIIEEGELAAGDEITPVRPDPQHVTVRALLGLAYLNEISPALAAKALQIEALPPLWREEIAEFLRG